MKQTLVTSIHTAIVQEVSLSQEDQEFLRDVMQEICMRLDWVETDPKWMERILSPFYHTYHALCDAPYRSRFASIIRAYYLLRSRLSNKIGDQCIIDALYQDFLSTPKPLQDARVRSIQKQLEESYE